MCATLSPGPTHQRTRLAGWMFALSPVPFAVAVAAVIAMDAGPIEDLTGPALRPIAALWVVFHLAFAIAIGMGCWAIHQLGRGLAGGLASAARIAAGLAVVAVLVLGVLRLGMLGTGDGRLGDLPIFPVALACSLLAVWFAAVATVLFGLALRANGSLRLIGAVVAVVGSMYVLADVITGGSFPPFVVSVLWVVVGVAVLRLRVPSA